MTTDAASPVDGGDTLAPGAVALCIRNYNELTFAYSENLARRVLDAVNERVAAFFGCDTRPVAVPQSGHLILPDSASYLYAFEKAGGIDSFLALIGGTPINVDDISVVVALSIGFDGAESVAETTLSAGVDLSPARYRQWMNEAVAVYDAIGMENLLLVFQPVRAVDDSGLLYREGLARIASPDGSELMLPGRFLSALEKLGLTRLFDRTVILQTIAALRALPIGCLGGNISARSAIDDEYWGSIFALLEADPAMACRLVIEITETSAISSIEAACKFIRRLKRAGCRIAVDDFGTGYSSIRQALSLEPDIIKIDGTFLRDALEKAVDSNFLACLVDLSHHLASHVVIEGVEDEAGLLLAHRAGAQWVQGYYIAKPCMLGGFGSS